MQNIPDKILSEKMVFTDCIDKVRMQIANKTLLDDKWLRPSDDLFKWYFSEFSRAKVPLGSTVFDLGAGPGYFLWFLHRFGKCSVSGIESQNREDYQMLWQSLKLEERILIQSIQRFVPINYYSLQYDYITALGICFDLIDKKSEKRWGVEEFSYFLSDACRSLKPNGVVYLRFNRLPPQGLFDFFKSLDGHDGDTRFRIRREAFLASPYSKFVLLN